MSFSLLESFRKVINIGLRKFPFFMAITVALKSLTAQENLNLLITSCLLSTGERVEKTWSCPQEAYSLLGHVSVIHSHNNAE